MKYTIGRDVSCSDGVCGELTRVVIDPVAKALTHLVIDPKHGLGIGRLVPIALVESAGESIRLRCSSAEFDKLEQAEERKFLPGASAGYGYGQNEMVLWPYYGMGLGGMGLGGIGLGNMDAGPQTITIDRVPVGEVEVRRGEQVHATDGSIGRVQGLVVDTDHHVTHVLLDEGHLWGKKEVAIPIAAVSGVSGDGVRLSLTKSAVSDLPPVELDHGE